MKIMRFLSLLLVGLLLAIFALGFVVKSISYDFTLDIQAPTYKAYDALASHEFKSIQYPNINASTAKVEPYEVGNTTFIDYTIKNKDRFVYEKVLAKDSLTYVKLESTSATNLILTEIHFEDKNKITRVHVVEEVYGSNAIQRAILFFIQRPIRSNKENLYKTFKTRIESTPDFQFSPEEQK